MFIKQEYFHLLSILIPIYQNDVTKLVQELNIQCQKCGIAYEIICFDDFSNETCKAKNQFLGQVIHTTYLELWENMGRAKIRNMLAKNARFNWLLFLDSDTKVKSKKFIKSYVSQLDDSQPIICGGRSYTSRKPKSIKKRLHWTYGSKKESRSLKERKGRPYSLFHSNNFVVKRKLFLDTLFDESISGYGYEDLSFAYILEKKDIPITHIDNPTLHNSLETNEQLLLKTKKAIQNLALLYKEDKIMETRLIKTFSFLKKTRMLSIFESWYERNSNKLFKDLIEKEPSLFKFDIFKLGEYATAIRKLTKSSVQ